MKMFAQMSRCNDRPCVISVVLRAAESSRLEGCFAIGGGRAYLSFLIEAEEAWTCRSGRGGKLNLSLLPQFYYKTNLRSKDAATNPRGIPYAPFVDKVEDYVSSRAEVDQTMKSFQEMISYVGLQSRETGYSCLTQLSRQKVPVHGSQYTKTKGGPG